MFRREIFPRLLSMGYDSYITPYQVQVDDLMPQPVSDDSESTDFDFSGLSSRSQVRSLFHRTQNIQTDL